MIEDWLIAIVPNLLVALFSFALGYLAFRDSSRPYRRWFAAQSISVGFLALVLMVEKFIVDLDTYLVLVVLEYGLEIVAMISLYVFVMSYTDRPNYADRRVLALLAAIGIGCLLLMSTNVWHGLWYRSNEMFSQGDFTIFQNVYGPTYLIWVALVLYILGSCVFVLLASYIHAPKSDRVKYTYVGLAVFWMIAAAAIYWVSSKDNPLLDILAIGLFGGTAILYYGAYWRSLLEAPPMSIMELFENVMDGAVLVNEQGKVAYWNKVAQKALTDENGQTYPVDLWLRDEEEYDIALIKNGMEVVLNIRCRNVPDESGEKAHVLVLRDVTDRRRTEKALADAYQKISVMQGISRHDIKNDLTVISGYVDIISQEGDERTRQRAAQIMKVLRRMDRHVQQAHDLPDLVSKDMEWRNVEDMARTAFHHHNLEGIKVECDLKGIEVLADKMFGNIIFNLADNSLRHADGLSHIKLNYHTRGDDIVIVFEDDGIGIPADRKERIFERGFGKNTGMGLYLAREIASLSGIEIVENGQKGARFELRVPHGRWRHN